MKSKNLFRLAGAAGALLITVAAAAFHPWSVFAAPAPAGPPPGTSAPPAGSYNVDPAHTNVNFAISHLGLSLVRGRFDDISGSIVADPDNLANSSVDITMKADSIDTSVKMRDDDLRGKNYFDVATYPTLTFKSTKIEKAHGRDGNYAAIGDLTIHGVTKSVRLPFSVSGPIYDPWGKIRLGLLTHIQLKRTDFGVGSHDLLSNGNMAIGDDVDVTISLEAVRPQPK